MSYRTASASVIGDRGELWIYREIGGPGGVSADQVRRDLKALGPKVTSLDVRVNSPGGDPFEALAIHFALARFPGEVRMHVDGWAASAAAVVIMAGDTISAAEDAMVLIHDPWGWCTDDDGDEQALADAVDRARWQTVAIFARRTGLPPDRVAALMEAEARMTAFRAVELGFVDAITPARRAPLDWTTRGYVAPPAPTPYQAGLMALAARGRSRAGAAWA